MVPAAGTQQIEQQQDSPLDDVQIWREALQAEQLEIEEQIAALERQGERLRRRQQEIEQEIRQLNSRAPELPDSAPQADKTDEADDGALVQYRGALRALRRGSYARARTAFSNWLDAYPGNVLASRVYMWLGLISRTQGDDGTARQYFTAVLSTFTYPEHPVVLDVLIALAEIERDGRRNEEAESLLRQLMRIAPDSAAALRAERMLDEWRSAIPDRIPEDASG
ncbi:MAG: hypothetical protein ISN29_06010 [Gammaproteobacteria bacterium AqS3]|nr:hypothetical protein [Gammaproteobacteria bacterium AqS3]